MNKLRGAVVGVGYLGRFHAQKYSQLEEIELVGVCDNDRERAKEVASELSCQAYNSYNSIYGQFFAPQGASFGGRSLPATDSTHVYTAYKVIKQIDSVLKGRAIPWYGEPGLGIQYMTNKADIDLLKEGYLIMTDSIPAHMAMK